MSTITNPASVKQENYINTLLKNVETHSGLDADQQDYLRRFLAAETLGKREASWLIGGLRTCPQKPRGEMAQPGYYVHQDGTYLVVIPNKAGNATYAKRLEVTKEKGKRGRARWTYAPGMGREVAHMIPMTLAQAAAFGHMYGVCFVCCRALTDPASVQRGIGPVCATKFGGPRPQGMGQRAYDQNQPEYDEANKSVEKKKPEPTVNVAALKRRQRNKP